MDIFLFGLCLSDTPYTRNVMPLKYYYLWTLWLISEFRIRCLICCLFFYGSQVVSLLGVSVKCTLGNVCPSVSIVNGLLKVRPSYKLCFLLTDIFAFFCFSTIVFHRKPTWCQTNLQNASYQKSFQRRSCCCLLCCIHLTRISPCKWEQIVQHGSKCL